MKYHLRRTLGPQFATYEELFTLLAHYIPLCALSDDTFKPTYLSPGNFLIGEPLIQLLAAEFTDVKCNILSRWQTYQQQLQQFWKHRSFDYLHSMQQRQRWQRTFPNPQTGDLNLQKKYNTTKLQRPTVVIKETHPGKDGIFRLITVRKPKGDIKCPIVKICP